MRIRPFSDLHLDHYKSSAAAWVPPDNDDYDVTVVAGDLSNPVMSRIEWVAKYLVRPGKRTIYSQGNHCGYRGLPGEKFEFTFWEEQTALLREFCIQNGIDFLDRSSVVIEVAGERVKFSGCVGWPEFAPELVPSNMMLNDAKSASQKGWWETPFNRVGSHNDFHEIRSGVGNSRHNLTPSQMIAWSKLDTAFLREAIAAPLDADAHVIVTHVGPASLVSAGMHAWMYGSRANEDLICSPDSGVSMWLSGHTHKTFDLEVGGIRCVSNGRGYPGENLDFDPALIVEVGCNYTPKWGM